MGNRHKVGDHKRGGKTDRDAEQRRVRHQVNRELATADDFDDLALPSPERKGGWVKHPAGSTPNAVPAERKRVRHWKQRWWKRRGRLRAERLALEDTEPAG